jgi:hypothetical protein
MASLTDIALVEKARWQAQALFEQDRNLTAENQPIAAELARFWGQNSGGTSVDEHTTPAAQNPHHPAYAL